MTWYGGATLTKKIVREDKLKMKIFTMRIKIGIRKV